MKETLYSVFHSLLSDTKIVKYEFIASQMIPKLHLLQSEMIAYTSPNLPIDHNEYKELNVSIWELITELKHLYLTNMMIFSDNLKQQIEDFLKIASNQITEYTSLKETTEPGHRFDPYAKEEVRKKRQIVEYVEKKQPKLLKLIDERFKKDISMLNMKKWIIAVVPIIIWLVIILVK